MNTFMEIKQALISLFKSGFPAFDVLFEEIVKTDDEDPLAAKEDWIYLDMIPAVNNTVNNSHTDRSILIDAAIHTKEESNAAYLGISQQVDGMLRPVFRFGTRAITVQSLDFQTTDRVLHAIFTLAFRDSAEEAEPLPLMETLEDGITIN
ncbi:DUF6838 family protein [Lachnospiraceae bacterium 54-53]